MASNQSEHARRVLCVVAGENSQAHPVVLAARDAGAGVVVVEDVYRATARLGGSGEANWAAVLVAVDCLDASEMEFFELIARFHRDLPVFVFAAGGSCANLDVGPQWGATQVIGPETAAGLLVPFLARSPVPDACEDEAGERRREREAAIDVALDRRLAALEPAANGDEAGEPQTQAERIDDSPVDAERQPQRRASRGVEEPCADAADIEARVPWRAYAETTRRRRPPRPPQPAPESLQPTEESEPPLLTQEELEALMGSSDEATERRSDEAAAVRSDEETEPRP